MISTPQYLRLFSTESRDAIYTRLQKLFHHGYLDRLGENPNAPLVYALGRRGAEVLEVSRRKDVGDRYLAHQLMIGDVRIAVTRAAKESSIEVSWGRVPEDQPVRPDGFFGPRVPTLPEGRNRMFFFLEADRSTMPRERFLAKLHAYQAWIFIDEFQSFTTLSVANMISELRKFHVGLVLAHQHLYQLEPEVRHAVLGNVGTLLAFRIGPEDAQVIAREFEPVFAPEDMVNLPNHDIYLKLMIDGTPEWP